VERSQVSLFQGSIATAYDFERVAAASARCVVVLPDVSENTVFDILLV
jgi:hypothetical protein